jgi:hypothetical protein
MLGLALILAVAMVLSVGIERIIRRLGIHPADVDAAKGGSQQLAESIERWARQRRPPS